MILLFAVLHILLGLVMVKYLKFPTRPLHKVESINDTAFVNFKLVAIGVPTVLQKSTLEL